MKKYTLFSCILVTVSFPHLSFAGQLHQLECWWSQPACFQSVSPSPTENDQIYPNLMAPDHGIFASVTLKFILEDHSVSEMVISLTDPISGRTESTPAYAVGGYFSFLSGGIGNFVSSSGKKYDFMCTAAHLGIGESITVRPSSCLP
jgi:hypothetical protein